MARQEEGSRGSRALPSRAVPGEGRVGARLGTEVPGDLGKCILLHYFQILLYFCRDRQVMKFVTLSLGQVTVTNPCVHWLVRAGKFGAVGIVQRWSQQREKNRGNKSEGRKSEGC